MNRAFTDVIGQPTPLKGATPEDALNGIPVAGRTDWSILQDTLARVGRELDLDLLGRLRERYVVHLRDEILHPGTGFNGTLPGVNVLLDALEPREDVYLGLLTGNFKDGAQVKLERFDLWRYFRCGAFGDDAAGSQRARARGARTCRGVRDAVICGRGRHRCRRHAQ